MKHGHVFDNVHILTLDFGCGKCYAVNPAHWVNYDPHHSPFDLTVVKDRMDVVICNYVLCTLPEDEHVGVLQEIQSLLKPNGVAFISVRNDRPKNGWGLTSKGTYQGRIEKLPGELIHKNSQFRIYRLTKQTSLE